MTDSEVIEQKTDPAEAPTRGEPGFWSLLGKHWKIARQLRHLEIHFDPERCKGIWECYEVCPVGCWSRDMDARVAVFVEGAYCIACGACVLQCPQEAIELKVPGE